MDDTILRRAFFDLEGELDRCEPSHARLMIGNAVVFLQQMATQLRNLRESSDDLELANAVKRKQAQMFVGRDPDLEE